MLDEYNKFWNNERLRKAKLIGLSKVEVSVLASIVQKESIMKEVFVFIVMDVQDLVRKKSFGKIEKQLMSGKLTILIKFKKE